MVVIAPAPLTGSVEPAGAGAMHGAGAADKASEAVAPATRSVRTGFLAPLPRKRSVDQGDRDALIILLPAQET